MSKGYIEIHPETTKDPIQKIGRRAGRCCGAPVGNPEKDFKRGLDCILANHGRTLEFVDVEMYIRGFSARVMREWYTHIGGAPTRLQESTRYIDYANGEFGRYVPEKVVAAGEEATKIYNDAVDQAVGAAAKLEEMGIPREDSGNLYPLGMLSGMEDKRNLRNLMDMSRQRMCTRAYHEYRDMFNDLVNALREYSPEWKFLIDELKVFAPKCEVYGFCTETYSCGRKPKLERPTVKEYVDKWHAFTESV